MAVFTQENREKVALLAVNHAFDKRYKEIAKRERELGLELYKAVFSAEELNHAKKLPAKWVRRDRCLRFNCGGYDLCFTIAESDDKGVPVPSDGSWCCQLGNVTGELAERAQKFAHEKTDLDKERTDAVAKILVMLKSLPSYKRLCEFWPEGERFYKQFKPADGTTTLPAVVVDEINKALGLSKGVK